MAEANADLRAAYLRLADPTGTPASLAFLVSGLGCVGAYGFLQPRGWVPRVVPWALAGTVAFYLVARWRARRRAKDAKEEALRKEFAERACNSLALARALPVRVAVWLGLGGWSWATVVREGGYPLNGDRSMATFLGAMGLLLGARYLYEWRIVIPAMRRDLEALGITPRG